MTMLESKLFTALSELGNAKGFGLKSEGPGKAPEDLVKAFEEAMANLDQHASDAQASLNDFGSHEFSQELTNEKVHEINFQDENIGIETQHENNRYKGPAEEVPSISSTDETQSYKVKNDESENINPHNVHKTEHAENIKQHSEELVQELSSLFEKISQPGASLSHMELYRAQYIMGMLKVQSQAGMKVSQNVSQGLESMLKQKE